MSPVDNYLQEILPLLIERGREARAKRDVSRKRGDSEQTALDSGRALGYYEVLSTMVNQLRVFGLSAASFGVPTDFDPDRDLA